jgi:hypothetical protein
MLFITWMPRSCKGYIHSRLSGSLGRAKRYHSTAVAVGAPWLCLPHLCRAMGRLGAHCTTCGDSLVPCFLRAGFRACITRSVQYYAVRALLLNSRRRRDPCHFAARTSAFQVSLVVAAKLSAV